jgi:hypothetical protein
VEGSCESGNEPSGYINAGNLSGSATGGLSSSAQLHRVSQFIYV